MPRPIWKGAITFGLVNIPVVLYSAEKKFDIQFKLLDSRDQSRIRYMRINEQTGQEVPWEEVAKGYEYEDHNYVLLKDKDIKSIAGENSKAIDIESFVSRGSVDCMYFDKPYYLVPDKKADKGYVILREVLNKTKKVGIAKVIIHTRQYLAVVMTYGNALVLNLLHYDQEIRKPEEFEFPAANIKAYKISSKELEIAQQLVASMTSEWKPTAYEDEFRVALQKWIDDKVHHAKPRGMPSKRKTAGTKKGNIVNFIDLLKKSLEEKKSSGKHRKSANTHHTPHKRAK